MRRAGNSREHLPALTGLRFVLALWVILDHLTGPGMMLEASARDLPPVLYALIRGGYLAVTTFFVLSGFVLARSYAAMEWIAVICCATAWDESRAFIPFTR